MKKPNLPEFLYHYTSEKHLPFILKAGCLTPTCSNLLPPDKETFCKKPHPIFPDSFVYWDKNQDFKPVVWLTKDDNATAEGTGLEGIEVDKTEFRFTFPFRLGFRSWRKFSVENGVVSWWRESIEEGRNHFDWYIFEGSLSLTGAKLHRRINGEWIEQNLKS